MKANVNIARFVEALDTMSKAGKNVPGLIMSKPGFGKTSTVEMWANYKGYNMTTLIPSRYSSDDVLGLQSMVNGKLKRLAPVWFESLMNKSINGNRNVLFIDEISTCDSYIQGPLFDLIFSHSLGEYKLPDNTLIIAAGNYSEDLNGDFKMTAPLVNRFCILNLNTTDYDLFEVLDRTFEKIKTAAQIEDYLKLKHELPAYDFKAFENWVRSTDEVRFNKSEFVELPNYGLLGFTSIRSFSYAMKFAETYINMYNDNLWINVVGDTLGTSVKNESKPMRDVLDLYSNKYVKGISTDTRSFVDICNEILRTNVITNADAKAIEHIFKKNAAEEFSSSDLAKWAKIYQLKHSEPVVQSLQNLLLAQMARQ